MGDYIVGSSFWLLDHVPNNYPLEGGYIGVYRNFIRVV